MQSAMWRFAEARSMEKPRISLVAELETLNEPGAGLSDDSDSESDDKDEDMGLKTDKMLAAGVHEELMEGIEQCIEQAGVEKL
jgi:hypothetical protein